MPDETQRGRVAPPPSDRVVYYHGLKVNPNLRLRGYSPSAATHNPFKPVYRLDRLPRRKRRALVEVGPSGTLRMPLPD